MWSYVNISWIHLRIKGWLEYTFKWKGGQETLIPSKYENTRKAREEFFPFEKWDIKYFCVNSSCDESTKIRLNKSKWFFLDALASLELVLSLTPLPFFGIAINEISNLSINIYQQTDNMITGQQPYNLKTLQLSNSTTRQP